MLQNGIVKKINKKTADVEITRSSACGESCASCGLCPGKTTVVTAFNNAGANVGDRVMLDLKNSKILGAAFLVYIVPLIALFAGYFIAHIISRNEIISVCGGFFLMAATFLVIILTDKHLKKKYTPVIVTVRKDNDE